MFDGRRELAGYVFLAIWRTITKTNALIFCFYCEAFPSTSLYSHASRSKKSSSIVLLIVLDWLSENIPCPVLFCMLIDFLSEITVEKNTGIENRTFKVKLFSVSSTQNKKIEQVKVTTMIWKRFTVFLEWICYDNLIVRCIKCKTFDFYYRLIFDVHICRLMKKCFYVSVLGNAILCNSKMIVFVICFLFK